MSQLYSPLGALQSCIDSTGHFGTPHDVEVAGTAPNPQPEGRYRDAGPGERRRIAGEVLIAYASHLDRLARRMTRTDEHREEAKQAGAIGVLVALERFDAAQGGFWPFACLYAKDEIRKWLERGVWWNKSTRHAVKNELRVRTNGGEALNSVYDVEGLEGGAEYVECNLFQSTLRSAERRLFVESGGCLQDDRLGEVQVFARLRAFVESLTESDRKELFSNREPQSRRAGRHMVLVEAARKAVRGDEEDT